MRKNFQEILNSVNVNITEEYYRLSNLFYHQIVNYRVDTIRQKQSSLHDYINSHFTLVSFRNTTLSLDDFDRTYDFDFEEYHANIDIEYFVTFCEYLTNIISDIMKHLPVDLLDISKLILEQIRLSIEKVSYIKINHKNMISFVPQNATAISVAEITEDNDIAYNTIFYNHHTLKNDLEGKKTILLKFAKLVEAKKEEAKGVCDKLLDNINYAMNNFNIRHNNIDKSSKSYQEKFANMSEPEKEELYDDTYQLCLEFFLALDNKNKITYFENLRKQ